MSSQPKPLPSSYRDHSGFVFEKDGVIYRQVNQVFKNDFEKFIQSGCYEKLANKDFVVKHQQLNTNLTGSPDWFTTLAPEKISYITYPYEWSFDMLKDAALLTLSLVKEGLPSGLILKDATPFNIQWQKGKPVLIDTLSFEIYDPSQPWIAYRQFCECFLAPLILMHHSGEPLQKMLMIYPDGIPLRLVKKLLPWKTKFSLHSYLHIHLHAKIAERNPGTAKKNTAFTETKLKNLVTSLEILVNSLQWKGRKTTWEDYYREASGREGYLEKKKEIIKKWLSETGPYRSILDLGGNTGEFSKDLISGHPSILVADFDHSAINNLYKSCKKNKSTHILPLVFDVANPSPAIGVNNEEREIFQKRIHTDIVFALALIHHLAIGKNIPFTSIAKFLSQISNSLLIEFVPKTDEKVEVMLALKKDIYSNYTEDFFEKDFQQYYSIKKKEEIGNTGRKLYLMEKHG